MIQSIVQLVALVSIGLAAGITVAVFLAQRAFAGSGSFYAQLMQLLARALTVPGPVLGLVALVAMIVDGVLVHRGGQSGLALVVVALVLDVVAGVVTKVGHFPINAQIAAWDPQSPPSTWRAVQARWSAFHVVRTLASVGSFVVFLVAVLVKGDSP